MAFSVIVLMAAETYFILCQASQTPSLQHGYAHEFAV